MKLLSFNLKRSIKTVAIIAITSIVSVLGYNTLMYQLDEIREIRAARMNNDAIELFEHGNYAKSIKLSEAALELDPDNPIIMYNLSQSYALKYWMLLEDRNWDREKVLNRILALSSAAVSLEPYNYIFVKDYALNHMLAFQYNIPLQHDRALMAWDHVAVLAPTPNELIGAKAMIARIYNEMDQLEKAVEQLDMIEMLLLNRTGDGPGKDQTLLWVADIRSTYLKNGDE